MKTLLIIVAAIVVYIGGGFGAILLIGSRRSFRRLSENCTCGYLFEWGPLWALEHSPPDPSLMSKWQQNLFMCVVASPVAAAAGICVLRMWWHSRRCLPHQLGRL